MHDIRTRISKAVQILIMLQIAAILLILAMLIYDEFSGLFGYTFDNKELSVLFFAINLPILIMAFISIVQLNKLNTEIYSHYQNLENLNKKLREQRHDFMNHLMIVGGMIELEDFEQAGKYIDNLYHEVGELNTILQTSKAGINALIAVKAMEARKNNITFFTHITTDLKQISIQDIELCRCLSNLIDNAIDAVRKESDGGCIWLRIRQTNEYVFFEVDNTGSEIGRQLQKKIFSAGFSTKNGDRGMGLYIVNEIVKKYKGTASYKHDNDINIFSLCFPLHYD